MVAGADHHRCGRGVEPRETGGAAAYQRIPSATHDTELTGRLMFQTGLTEEQRTLLDAALTKPKHPHPHDEHYPPDRAKRWVFERTLSLRPPEVGGGWECCFMG